MVVLDCIIKFAIVVNGMRVLNIGAYDTASFHDHSTAAHMPWNFKDAIN